MNDVSSHLSLSTPEEADLQHYGAISPLAIGALLLGLASFLALSSLLLLVIPVLAVLVALFALQRIAGSEGAMIGRTPAIIGLLCALLFAAIALSSVISRNRALEREAIAFASDWLVLVREGDLYRAHELHLHAKDRQLPRSSLPDYYASNEDAKEKLDVFFGNPLVEVIRSLDDKTSLQADVVETTLYGESEHVVVRFKAAGASPADFVIIVERAATEDGGIWSVVQVAAPKEEA